jgi:ribosome biogenesis protein MAK21
VYKNPKKKASGIEGKGKGVLFCSEVFADVLDEWFAGASAMQPAGSAVEGVKLRKGEVPDVQVNQPAFWKKRETQVPVDQMFFYNYFKRKDELERKNKKKREEEDVEEDVEEENEEEEEENEEDSEVEEEEVWKVRCVACLLYLLTLTSFIRRR